MNWVYYDFKALIAYIIIVKCPSIKKKLKKIKKNLNKRINIKVILN